MYNRTDLSNNLRIVSCRMKERESLAIGFWIGTGGRFESEHNKGIAHFLEHILFKGSQKYSCGDIKRGIEGVGGSLNAFTSEEATCYYAKIPAKHFKMTLDILSDMVMNPLVGKGDVERERAVIIEEIKMYHDLPQYRVLELLDEMVWPNHPLGQALSGTVESVSGMTDSQVKLFHSEHYVPGNMVLAVSGHVDHERLTDTVRRRLEKLKPAEPAVCRPFDGLQEKPAVRLFKKPTEQMHVAFGVHALHHEHPDRFALHLLNIILGGNMSSRLFDELREKRGLAYSISSGVKLLNGTGAFLIRAGVDNAKLIDAVKLVLQELKKVRQAGVTRSELIHAKDYFLGQAMIGLEDTMDHMLWIGDAILSKNRFKTIEEVARKIKRVKLEDVQRVARDVLREKAFNLAVVGPVTDPQEKHLRSLMGIR